MSSNNPALFALCMLFPDLPSEEMTGDMYSNEKPLEGFGLELFAALINESRVLPTMVFARDIRISLSRKLDEFLVISEEEQNRIREEAQSSFLSLIP